MSSQSDFCETKHPLNIGIIQQALLAGSSFISNLVRHKVSRDVIKSCHIWSGGSEIIKLLLL
jgi:hypothetical protein